MYGAEIVYSEGAKGSNGAVEVALEMSQDPGYYMPYQYGNEANPLRPLQRHGGRDPRRARQVAAFVGGLGTGGTLMGNGRRLKEADPETLVVAAEPMQGELVQGLRSLDDGFIPPIIDISLFDRKIMVSNRDAIVWTRKLLDEEGIFAGVSSGAIARDRGPDRRGARGRQRRLPDPRRRLEVPLLRRLHEADRRDREPGLHRLVVGRPRIGVAARARHRRSCSRSAAGRALAKPGQVDPRYGYNGTVDITDALPGPEFQRGVLAEAVGPQDESVVLSYATRPCPGEQRPAPTSIVTRVLADGTLDAAFGARAGVVAAVEWGTPMRAGEGPHGAIAVQPDGKVVVAAGDAISARVARLNPDGSHDASFRNPAEPARPAGEVSRAARRRGDGDRPGDPRRTAR